MIAKFNSNKLRYYNLIYNLIYGLSEYYNKLINN